MRLHTDKFKKATKDVCGAKTGSRKWARQALKAAIRAQHIKRPGKPVPNE